jgi:hypothetical protein
MSIYRVCDYAIIFSFHSDLSPFSPERLGLNAHRLLARVRALSNAVIALFFGRSLARPPLPVSRSGRIGLFVGQFKQPR